VVKRTSSSICATWKSAPELQTTSLHVVLRLYLDGTVAATREQVLCYPLLPRVRPRESPQRYNAAALTANPHGLALLEVALDRDYRKGPLAGNSDAARTRT